MPSNVLNQSTQILEPGATYKLVVRSAEEAVETLRAKLGENVKVLSVRQLPSSGLGGLFAKPKLEVIAQIPAEERVELPLPEHPVQDNVEGDEDFNEVVYPPSLAARMGETGLRRESRAESTRWPDLLNRAGFSSGLVNRLQSHPSLAGSEEKPLHRTLVGLGDALRQATKAGGKGTLPVRTAFLGASGCGRTTALCKWLAAEVFSRGKTGRVLKVEFDRPNPAEGLGVFCEALGLYLEHICADDENGELSGDFEYYDMPGLAMGNRESNVAHRKFLDKAGVTGRVLVLNAAYDLQVLRRAYSAGLDVGATHVVFTHLDEVVHWGKLWDFLMEGTLMPLFLTTGPSLTGDIDERVVDTVIRRTLPVAGMGRAPQS